MNRLLDALIRVTRSEEVIISLAVANNKLVYDVLDLGTILANDTDKNNTVSNELLDQSIKTRLISLPTVQHYFFWVRHASHND